MHAGLGECWVGMYVVMFGMACIEGAGLCIVCGSVIYIVVVLDGLVGIHDMDTPGKEAGGTGRGICIIVMWNGTISKSNFCQLVRVRSSSSRSYTLWHERLNEKTL
jgi:hypothetical protein